MRINFMYFHYTIMGKKFKKKINIFFTILSA